MKPNSTPSNWSSKFISYFTLNSSTGTPSYAPCAEVTQRSKALATTSLCLAIKYSVLAGSHVAATIANALANGGPDNSPEVTMTSVVNGETGTVIWEPMTLDGYKGLRASTTVALTESAFASAADSGLGTVVAVVFAGGVAWYLAY
jgi:hypothetical protein